MPTGRKCSLAILHGFAKQSHGEQHPGRAPDPECGQGQGRKVLPQFCRPPTRESGLSDGNSAQDASGSWDSSCLTGLVADLLSKAELPFWEEGRVIHVHAHTRVSQEKAKVQSTRLGMAQLPEEAKGCRESHRG